MRIVNRIVNLLTKCVKLVILISAMVGFHLIVKDNPVMESIMPTIFSVLVSVSIVAILCDIFLKPMLRQKLEAFVALRTTN